MEASIYSYRKRVRMLGNKESPGRFPWSLVDFLKKQGIAKYVREVVFLTHVYGADKSVVDLFNTLPNMQLVSIGHLSE